MYSLPLTFHWPTRTTTIRDQMPERNIGSPRRWRLAPPTPARSWVPKIHASCGGRTGPMHMRDVSEYPGDVAVADKVEPGEGAVVQYR